MLTQQKPRVSSRLMRPSRCWENAELGDDV